MRSPVPVVGGPRRDEFRPVPQHRVHDNRQAASYNDLALRIVDRSAIAKAQSLSFSWPL